MGRLLIVSNRLPVNVVKREGKLQFQSSTGGLATGLGSFYKSYQGLWIGWPGISSERIDKKEKKEIETRLNQENCYPCFLSQSNIENYYYGFSNKTIWPLFHYFLQYTAYNKNLWESYKRVNEIFCDTVMKIAKPDDTIWIQDYHLLLLPQLIKQRLPNANIGFFLHIPFPSFEVFRLLPWRKEILEGLLGASLVGFHTYNYVWHFLDSVHRILGYEHTLGQITVGNRVIKADAFPMGIDYKKFNDVVDTPGVQKEINRIRKKVGKHKIILSIDRLDYTKGIPQRLETFETFLEKYPEYKEKVTLIILAVPSRSRMESYMLLKKQVDELVGRINGKNCVIGWMPVWYLYRSLPFHALVALYSVADVGLVTPLRDGMNLIAKEFIATKTDGKGVLILSEMAGASKELGEAIIVNSNNKEEVAKALKDALTMSDEEQVSRNRVMQKRLQRYDVIRWANDFMDSLSHVKKIQQELHVRKLTQQVKKKLINGYFESKKRLILLDYDGTLVDFAEKPEKAVPDNELFKLLEVLTQEQKNEVVIISGRDKKTLGKWFGHLNIVLIAEHGVWIKDIKKKWEVIEPLRNDWKEQIQSVLELYVDRTPGSFIEEKDFSLVWHYRKADPALALVRSRELKNTLLHLTANLNLGVLEGNKVIEIKNTGVNKGFAVLHWIANKKEEFILAIGDDWTDEDMFTVLPESAYSIKVGVHPSRAKFNVDSPKEVRLLLRELGGKNASFGKL